MDRVPEELVAILHELGLYQIGCANAEAEALKVTDEVR